MITPIKYPEKKDWESLLKRPTANFDDLDGVVKTIIENVIKNGDKALLEYAFKFDKANLSSLKVSEEEIAASENEITEGLKQAILQAKQNIEKFHKSQLIKEEAIETQPGVLCWRKSVAIQKVGFYIPGGSAPLFSTVLMLAVPAVLAGCKEITICTPANSEGKINPAILYTANVLGIKTIFKVGGAQAIAAMAYGTESIKKVYKIFGPGNQFVTYAKQLVANTQVAIDMPAGPSEVAVIADKTCVPKFVAADLLSQAEHGKDSQVLLVSPNESVIQEIITEVEKQLQELPRQEIALEAIKNSKFILVTNLEQALELVNEYAPEHLILACNDTLNLSTKVINAGSVFIGNYSCESAGDYASGTNHTLPTNGYAKNYSGVSVDSFVKKITFQQLSKEGITNIGKTIELMAEAEGLIAHKNAVSIRLK